MHACDLTRRIFSTVCAAPAQNTETNRSALSQRSLSSDLLAQTYGDGYIPFVLEVNIDEHQSFHGLA